MADGIALFKDELITCENGHPFGRVKRFCEAGKGDWMEAIDWLQYTPSEGGSMACNACGARWVWMIHLVDDPSQKRARLYVNGEWRPPLDDRDRKHMAGENTVIE